MERTMTKHNSETAPRDTVPRDGESLEAWVNRIRPGGTPEVAGIPAFMPMDGLGWVIEGWGLVTVEVDEAGRPAVHWHVESDSMVVGYSRDADGRLCAFVNTDDGVSAPVEGWPVAS